MARRLVAACIKQDTVQNGAKAEHMWGLFVPFF